MTGYHVEFYVSYDPGYNGSGESFTYNKDHTNIGKKAEFHEGPNDIAPGCSDFSAFLVYQKKPELNGWVAYNTPGGDGLMYLVFYTCNGCISSYVTLQSTGNSIGYDSAFVVNNSTNTDDTCQSGDDPHFKIYLNIYDASVTSYDTPWQGIYQQHGNSPFNKIFIDNTTDEWLTLVDHKNFSRSPGGLITPGTTSVNPGAQGIQIIYYQTEYPELQYNLTASDVLQITARSKNTPQISWAEGSSGDFQAKVTSGEGGQVYADYTITVSKT